MNLGELDTHGDSDFLSTAAIDALLRGVSAPTERAFLSQEEADQTKPEDAKMANPDVLLMMNNFELAEAIDVAQRLIGRFHASDILVPVTKIHYESLLKEQLRRATERPK